MKRMLAYVAGAGFVLSFIWHLLTWAGVGEQVSGPSTILFVGIFVVWFPTVLHLQKAGRTQGKDWLKYAAVGAPAWMSWVARISFYYAIANMILGFVLARGGNELPGGFGRYGSGHAMAFYAIACVVLYAAAVLEETGLEWKCERGHAVRAGARYCEECGSPVPDVLAAFRGRID